MTHFVIVRFGQDSASACLEAVLAGRGRPVLEQAPAEADAAGARAVVLLGQPDSDDEAGVAAACVAADVPLLALGGAAGLLGGGSTPDGAVSGILRVERSAAADDDAMFAGLADGTSFLTGAPPGPAPEGALALATHDGEVVAFRVGERAYGVRFRPEVGAGEAAAALRARGAEELAADVERRARHLDAAGQALLGRWVDGVVGRTEDEAPWGRKGPKPVPRPGLSLHPR